MLEQRYFYHSFPRRGANRDGEIIKGLSILRSIRDIGLALVPEFIEWRQPNTDGGFRVFPRLQVRTCFTELNPSELSQHADRFGHFALEFDTAMLRMLGATPVFYVPQPIGQPSGNALGIALLAVTTDAANLTQRMAALQSILDGPTPVADRISFDAGFEGSPELRKPTSIHSAESKILLSALGAGLTPLSKLSTGMDALLNFFYPADDFGRGGELDYYRQREWRIACKFAVQGQEVLREPTDSERKQLISLDPEFFRKLISNGVDERERVASVLINPGLNGRTILELVRRVIVPSDALEQARDIVSTLDTAPEVVTFDGLS